MLSQILILIAAQAAPSAGQDPFVVAARGMARLADGDVDEAFKLLATARAQAPDDFVILRDYAAAALRVGRLDDALLAIDRAIELGDADPEAQELRAVILAERGDIDGAQLAADDANTDHGTMIGAVLGDRTAAYRLVPLLEETSRRGALASLVLAANEGAAGDIGSARRLGTLSAKLALSTDAFQVLGAARSFEERVVDEGDLIRHHVRLRAGLDYATNANYRSDSANNNALRAAFTVDGGLEIPFGSAVISAALRYDQHAFVTDREIFAPLDLTALSVAARVDIAVAQHPTAALVGFSARYTDVFARLFREHYAASIEAGPDLTIQVTAGMRLRLSFYGVLTDFIDLSPPSAIVSSVNRDRVGQRAALTLLIRNEWLSAIAEGVFLHDDARGDAFDALGGAAAGRVVASIGGGVQIYTGFTVTVRQYGPVGDSAIIGPAATRSEVRTVAELGARLPLFDLGGQSQLGFFMEDVWINNSARTGHRYTENVLSLGIEATL